MNKLKTGILSSSYTGTGSGGGSDMHSMGYYETSADLTAAYPVGEAGDWAIVGATDTVWVWDLATAGWKDTGQGAVVAWGGISGVLANQLDLKNALDGKQAVLWFTPENAANKVTSFQVTPDNTHYPSEKLVKDGLDGKLNLDQTTPQSIINGVPLLVAENGDISDPYHLVNKDFIDKRTRGGGGFLANVLFRTDDSDKPDVGTKYKRIDYLMEAAETELTATVKASEGDKLLRTYLYDGALETTLLDAGIYTVNYRAKVSGSAGITQLGFEAFVMDIAGVETTLFTSWSTELNNTDYLTLRNESNQPSYTVNATDRFGVRIYARTTHASDITVTTVVGGEHGSYFSTPLPLRHNLLRSRDASDAHPVSSISNAQNEILPIEIFEDGTTPPAELDITDGKRYRDFTVGDDADLYVLKRANYNSPANVRLVMVISNATAPAIGETINFEVSINGGTVVTLSYVGLGTEAHNDVIITDFESVAFGTGNYTVSLERVSGTYAQEIGVMAVEVN
jgi:hypothetical protein